MVALTVTRAAYYRAHRARRFGLWVQWRTGCLVVMMRRAAKVPEYCRPFAWRQLREAWDEGAGRWSRHHASFAPEKGWMGVEGVEPWVRDGIWDLLREGLVKVIQGDSIDPTVDWLCRPVPRTWMCWLDLRPLFGVSGGYSIHQPLWLRGVR